MQPGHDRISPVDQRPREIRDTHQGKTLAPEGPRIERPPRVLVDQDEAGQCEERLPGEMQQHLHGIARDGSGIERVTDYMGCDDAGEGDNPEQIELMYIRTLGLVL